MVKKKKVLVSGGAGYIGSHTAVSLIDKGYEVFIIDNLSNSDKDSIDGIEKITGIRPGFFEFDLCDLNKLDDFFNKNPVDAVIHFAAHKAVGESVDEPIKYYRNNILSLLNILEMMKKYKVRDLVFSSSCTVYREPDALPINETAEIKPANSPYGNTKQIAEEIIRDAMNADKDLNALALRYFNPIGAHKSAMIGEKPNGVPANLLPYLTQVAIGKRDYLQVFGNDYDTADGTCIRDYIHIEDLAEAHVAALDYLEKNDNQTMEVINIGTGKGYSVLEIIETFEKVNGVKINYKIYPRRNGDVVAVFADASKAKKILGWSTKRDLESMLKSAWEWEMKLGGK